MIHSRLLVAVGREYLLKIVDVGEDEKVLELDEWLHNRVNALNVTELYS